MASSKRAVIDRLDPDLLTVRLSDLLKHAESDSRRWSLLQPDELRPEDVERLQRALADNLEELLIEPVLDQHQAFKVTLSRSRER